MERRRFLGSVLATGMAAPAVSAQKNATGGVTASSGTLASKLPRATDTGELRGEMLYRKLGRTGETVSAIGLGGSHIAKPALTDVESVKLIRPPSTAASRSSIIPGITTRAAASAIWEGAIGRRLSQQSFPDDENRRA